jgi:hypothetical protein
MKLADLVPQVQLLGHNMIAHQVICHDDAHPQALHQRLQPAAKRPWIGFIHMSQSDGLAAPKVYHHQNRALLSLALHIGLIHPQHPHPLPLILFFQLFRLILCIPPHRHLGQSDRNPLKIMLTPRKLNPSIQQITANERRRSI